MSSIGDEIRARLITNGSISALVGNRVYELRPPQAPTPPYVTYQKVSGPRFHQLNGPSNHSRSRIQIDIWAKRSEEVDTVARLIKISLDGFNGTLVTAKASILMDNEQDDYEESASLYRIIQDYMVLHSDS